MPASVQPQHRPLRHTPSGLYGTWPADTKTWTQRSHRSTNRSAVSANGPTRRCWPPTKLGPDTAAALLTAAGDNPGRMNTNTAFAALYAPSPVPASSGRTVRHRLNRGGNRQANNALWRVATNRMRHDPPTKEYVTRRQAEGKTRPEILRCLKRHIAREVYHLLTDPPPTPHGAQLRNRRQQARITLTHAAHRLDTQPTVLSQLERGLSHNHHLATRYQQWLNTHQPICKT